MLAKNSKESQRSKYYNARAFALDLVIDNEVRSPSVAGLDGCLDRTDDIAERARSGGEMIITQRNNF